MPYGVNADPMHGADYRLMDDNTIITWAVGLVECKSMGKQHPDPGYGYTQQQHQPNPTNFTGAYQCTR